MSDHLFDRAVRDWLEDGSDRTPRSAIDGVLLAVKTTPQERDLRIPWRFTRMTTTMRLAAGIALVAVLGVGFVQFLGPGSGVGSRATPSPSPTIAPTLPPGITGWSTYTSKVYGYTLSYPSDWSVHAPATHKWQTNEPTVDNAWPWADVFVSPEGSGDETIGMWTWQIPAPTGSDLGSWEGLKALVLDVCDAPGFFAPGSLDSCVPAPTPTPMCLGLQECQPAIVVVTGVEQVPWAFFGDPETGIVTVFQMGRPDNFAPAARYGGTIALLKAILAKVDVRPPQPGETPH